jgi:hypothetical protein
MMTLLDRSIARIDEAHFTKIYKDKLIFGYWRQNDCKYHDLPHPLDFEDVDWNEYERNNVIKILKTAYVHESWKGWSNCRICGIMNGSQCMNYKGLIFPEGLIHYIKEHAVKPPDNILKHIYENLT